MKLFVAMPCYSGKLSATCANSLLGASIDLLGKGHVPDVRITSGNCYIALARNQSVSDFLKTDAEAMIFIDDDVGFPFNAISKLIETGKDIVGGVYPKKSESEDYPIRCFVNEDGTPKVDDGLIECDGLPTGFLFIRRNVIEKLIELHPERKFYEDRLGDAAPKMHHNLFSCEVLNEKWWGEDFFFCQLALQAGFKIWCMPDLNFSHAGTKYWQGNYHEFLIKQAAP